MVSARRPVPLKTRVVCIATAAVASLALVSFLALPRAARADTTYTYDVNEHFTITVNSLGDAHFKDVYKYDKAFFSTAGFKKGTYPAILVRRYRQMVDSTEIENLKSTIDMDTATITISFDQKGRAYNEGDHWMMYGFPDKPDLTAKSGARVFQSESTENNEFTLGQDLKFKTMEYLVLPKGSTDIRWDRDKHAMRYAVAYTEPAPPGTVLQNNRAVFIPVFAVLLILSAGIAVYFLLRRRPAAAAVPQLAAGGGAPAALPDPGPPPELNSGPSSRLTSDPQAGQSFTAPPVATGSMAGAAEAASPAETPAPATSDTAPPSAAPDAQPAGEGDEPVHSTLVQAHFCRHCGAPLPEADCNFCPVCGGRLTDH